MELESRGLDPEIPFEKIRRHLSRAIGFFLFDDVEVPSLIGFTLSNEDVLVSLPSASTADGPHIVSLPILTHALWADPMLETLFMPPGPSQALLEAYADGGGPLILFPRQRTKRIWYTLFLAGVVLVVGVREDLEKVKWATELIRDCVEKLKDAPYY